MDDPTCYVCGHTQEEHHEESKECEYDDGDGNGCAVECRMFEPREDVDWDEEDES